MGEVGGAVERVDVPAVLRGQTVAGSLFAVNPVRRERYRETRLDERFAGAVGFCNQVDIALVLCGDATLVVFAE